MSNPVVLLYHLQPRGHFGIQADEQDHVGMLPGEVNGELNNRLDFLAHPILC